MNKYIIIVSVYDCENTQAYPLGGVFDTHKQAEEYIKEHLQEIKDAHWTSGYVNGEGGYREEFSMGNSFHAYDMYDGASLDIEIFTLPVMTTGEFVVCYVTREVINSHGFDAGNNDMHIYEKETKK